MRKKLRLDDLAVESFEAGGPTPARGTVRAHNETGNLHCTNGCSVDHWSCPCATLAYQLECAEVTNFSCLACGSGGDPSLAC